ncbi:unnamed protein product [Phytomonas sp. Hart1]|nr:unnamed protein product [Phytomonas sp. Hart1]|eukprot:CCW67811.1 unnamed protein product [Phytomonas sp. isolate Hart1]
MLQHTRILAASLRYRRPYWMLFLKGVDNWRIYTVIQQPDHQRTEMLYQAWLGGLDRPYVRPKCMAHQPLWLSKKRHILQKSRLQGPETAMEKYVLEWYRRFHSFQGTERPTAEDLHIAFDLVERPLDLSYACQLLHQCRNINNIRFDHNSFLIFLEACLRVDRKDCAQYALENAEVLGFWHIHDDWRKYLDGEQSWYRISPLDGLYYPLNENSERNATRIPPADVPGMESRSLTIEDALPTQTATEATPAQSTLPSESKMEEEPVDDEILRLQAELESLESEISVDNEAEKMQKEPSNDGGKTDKG